MIALKDDGIAERNRTLSYFKNQSMLRYREFVEDVAHKYVVQENNSEINTIYCILLLHGEIYWLIISKIEINEIGKN